ncbi:hypothetical protein IAE35_02850 [Pseudomonas sp. S75]|uniref:hypothetical protein n=1 Tax=unclassified Pseudomonas TaxID=196821 RepID=UPI0019057E81|nr:MULTISPECIES: hypothetical protein [unclassified Pseudomonas]MBJ9974979.1 hypothetical protein [Pseudomonas sp. S30]MBK0152267.1 hypothetical protein [Pseudomonas sp. S75]
MSEQFEYYLRQAFLGNIPHLELDKSEYDEIVKAKDILDSALAIEEKYDLVLGNFVDFERELLVLTMDGMFDISFDYGRAYNILSVLNRRAANFVIMGKNYTELISSMASKSAKDKVEVAAKVKQLSHQIYDTSFEYRFAEALRNHIAHSADAVHSVGSPHNWLMGEDNQAETLVFNLEVFSLKERLLLNAGFKRSVLNDCEDKIDLKITLRKYMGAISEIQDEVRALTKTSVDEARNLIQGFTDRYEEINKGDAFGLAAYSQSDSESGKKPLSISLEWDNVRIKLEEKNQSISNMDKRCVSSAIVKGRKK